jgi:hypothetical protein
LINSGIESQDYNVPEQKQKKTLADYPMPLVVMGSFLSAPLILLPEDRTDLMQTDFTDLIC